MDVVVRRAADLDGQALLRGVHIKAVWSLRVAELGHDLGRAPRIVWVLHDVGLDGGVVGLGWTQEGVGGGDKPRLQTLGKLLAVRPVEECRAEASVRYDRRVGSE